MLEESINLPNILPFMNLTRRFRKMNYLPKNVLVISVMLLIVARLVVSVHVPTPIIKVMKKSLKRANAKMDGN